ncbi:dihydrodipicolinate synthase family protein [Nonomuraea sp. NPDC046802]|uniref:dihydrodipicolinate synthase family protein n=1 Tax=Nonomuraea sp. NPDC046802 TaxID=3154919 RepID=UPI0033EB4564
MDIRLATGVWGVVATPFHGAHLEVDHESLARLVRHYASCGVSGLTVLGVFGEAVRLTTAERRRVLETVTEAVALPMVVGTTGSATAPVAEEIELIQNVLGGRLAGAMVQVNTGDPVVLAAHLATLHAGTGAPIVVQDYPVATGVRIPTSALISALDSLPGVAAVKAEAPPTPLAVSALTSALDVPVFGGLGGIGLLDELAAGAAGAMTGFSFPEGLVAATTAWRTGGYEAARDAFLPYLPLVNFEQQAGPALAIRKRCLQLRGLFADASVRPPAPGMPAALEGQLTRHLAALAGV